MKILQLKRIKEYKSFSDFKWSSFMNTEEFDQKMNIIYGENGSGKTSICNIIKSLSEICEFEKYTPSEACIQTNDNEYTFSRSNEWDQLIQQNSIVFFDKEFVNKNIHLGHIRGRQQGEQEQESGNLIIEFDNTAIELRKRRDEEKEEYEKLISHKKDFDQKNEEILSFILSDQELILYNELEKKSKIELDELKKSLEQEKYKIQINLNNKRNLQKKVSEIQNINDLEKPELTLKLSNYDEYDSVFKFEFETPTIQDENKHLSEKINRYQHFFSTGFEIRAHDSGKCPFCQSNSVEKEIEQVDTIYKSIFDQSYEESVKEFNHKRDKLIDELSNISSQFDEIDVRSVMLVLKRLESNYNVEKIYSITEEENLVKPSSTNILVLRNKLIKLEKPNNEEIRDVYKEVTLEINKIEGFYKKLKELIQSKNKLIDEFKRNSTDKKLKISIEENDRLLQAIHAQELFIDDCKIEKQKQKINIEIESQNFQKVIEKSNNKYQKTKSDYEEYVSTKAYQSLLEKISNYFKNFNLTFKLELDITSRRPGLTKDFPFAFKILDAVGKERDFKDGISDGELQVLSLCFFFAFLDIQSKKGNKIVIFDDPITSLDNNNLISLVEQIGEIVSSYSQVFIFTHHKLFFKFLRNKYKKSCNEYNILRNKNEFGGSFICKSEQKKFIEKLKGLEKHLLNISKGHINIELIIVEYGQYLRYEVERFIKNNLLHWNDYNNFGKAIDGVKNNKNISDDDLDVIKQIHSFCNWTTSHVDVGDDHGLGQLKQKISSFVKVIENNEV